jgi:hypothetical protein
MEKVMQTLAVNEGYALIAHIDYSQWSRIVHTLLKKVHYVNNIERVKKAAALSNSIQ